jgi:ABC-type methionine transport system ATPase subunit
VPKPKANPASGKTASKSQNGPQRRRLWLMFPPKKIKNPVIWELGHKFEVITNIRQASITDELGIVCLELEGNGSEIGASIRWLEKSGINVEPVEINVLES